MNDKNKKMAKYISANYRTYIFRLNKIKEKEIIQKLDSLDKGEKVEYFREAMTGKIKDKACEE